LNSTASKIPGSDGTLPISHAKATVKAGGQITTTCSRAAQANTSALEAAATEVRTFAVQTIPGLLQTADYAAAVTRATRPDLTAEQVNALVTMTMRRQELSQGRRQLHAIIDESALLRALGSPAIMAAQLDHLSSANADHLVTVQVLRLAASQELISPGFTLLRFTDEADTDVGCRSESDDQVTLTIDSRNVSRLRNTFERLTRHAASADSSADLIRESRTRYSPPTS